MNDEIKEIELKETNQSVHVDNDIDNIIEIDKTDQPNSKPISSTPIWVWVILVIALLSMSSAATALKLLDRVPPLLKASWRLQSTSLFLFFGLFYDLNYYFHWIRLEEIQKRLYTLLPRRREYRLQKDDELEGEGTGHSKEDQRALEFQQVKTELSKWKNLGLIFFTGIILGAHFAFWVVSLNKTSLSHSLLFVTSSPIMVIIVMFILRKPITKGEIIGTLIGFAGLLITLIDSLDGSSTSDDSMSSADNGTNPTVFGDILALLAAVCIVFYFFVGQTLRKWLPLFFYAFPVTFIGSLFLTILSLCLETPPTPLPGESFSVVGWMSSSFVGLVLYLAIFPGLFGHTSVNGILKYIEVVIISVTLLLEPAIGSVMGYVVGVSDIPQKFTFIGGPIIIIGCIMTTISSHKKQLAEKQTKPNTPETRGE